MKAENCIGVSYMKKTHAAVVDDEGSPLAKYLDVVVGSSSWRDFLYYEFCLALGPLPGAVGMVLRKTFWPRMFGSCGQGTLFGAGIVVRHPGRIRLGRSVIISEGCILDARHCGSEQVIALGDNVMLSNNVMISCKNGSVAIGNDVGINAQTIIQSTNNCPVSIGDDCVVGQRCFIIGGGNYQLDRLDIPVRKQSIKADGGVRLERDVWLGGNVSVLGGVTMGESSVAAAGSVVTRSVPKQTICMGIPAREVKKRRKGCV